MKKSVIFVLMVFFSFFVGKAQVFERIEQRMFALGTSNPALGLNTSNLAVKGVYLNSSLLDSISTATAGLIVEKRLGNHCIGITTGANNSRAIGSSSQILKYSYTFKLGDGHFTAGTNFIVAGGYNREFTSKGVLSTYHPQNIDLFQRAYGTLGVNYEIKKHNIGLAIRQIDLIRSNTETHYPLRNRFNLHYFSTISKGEFDLQPMVFGVVSSDGNSNALNIGLSTRYKKMKIGINTSYTDYLEYRVNEENRFLDFLNVNLGYEWERLSLSGYFINSSFQNQIGIGLSYHLGEGSNEGLFF